MFVKYIIKCDKRTENEDRQKASGDTEVEGFNFINHPLIS